MTKKISNKKLAFCTAFVYVILATTYGIWAMTNLESDGVLFYIFLPATIFPTLILFTQRDPGLMILICQIITLFIIWLLFWLIIHLFRDDNIKQDIDIKSL